MSEAIASQLSGGAGRLIDMSWPTRYQFRNGGGTPPQVITNRIGNSNPQSAAITYSVNPNSGWNAALNGRSGASFGAVAAGAPNGMQWSFHPMMFLPALRAIAGAPDLALVDEYGAYRVKMLAWFVNPAAPLGAAVDNGLEITTAGGGTIDDGRILNQGTPGLGFRVYDADRVEAIMRPSQAGAVTRVDLLTAANGYRAQDWHSYEIRVIAAHGTTEAVAKFFIDGTLKLTMQWGPGNIMPETNANYAGFKVHVVTTAGTAGGFAVDSVDFHAARNELNLL